MSRYIIPIQDGTYNTESGGGVRTIGKLTSSSSHQLSFSYSGATPAAGTLQVFAKADGCDVYEPLPDGAIDLTAPLSLLFTFRLKDYQFVLSGVSGSGDITIIDFEI